MRISRSSKRKWKKNRVSGAWEVRTAFTSQDPNHLLDLGADGREIYHVCLSGWSYQDGVPQVMKDFVQQQVRPVEVNYLIFHVGINSVRHNLTEKLSNAARKAIRDEAKNAFVAMFGEIKTTFPRASVLFLGTSAHRKNRTPGDEDVCDPRTTTEMLRNVNKDVGEVNKAARDHVLEGGGRYYNACRAVTDHNVADRHGHITDDFLDWVVMNLGLGIFTQLGLI